MQQSADDDEFPYSGWTTPYRTDAGPDAILAAQGSICCSAVEPAATASVEYRVLTTLTQQ